MDWKITIFLGCFFPCVISRISHHEVCNPSYITQCLESIANVTVNHEDGLFQNAEQLVESCKSVKEKVLCLDPFKQNCYSVMSTDQFNDQFGKPLKIFDKLCDAESQFRAEYLAVAPCMKENVDQFLGCSEKVGEFLTNFEAETEEHEKTTACMYDMMFRSCLMSTAASTCGLEAGSFVRKAVQFLPPSGIKSCFDILSM